MITLGNSFFSFLLHTPGYAGGIAVFYGDETWAIHGRNE
ncbi:hypothetical protein J2Z65_004691 [Paenibacillus aceris]|uniref:Uncharacterized protein n=1 Tax=Paenibacillus aceris TaxID=869555 RepID=A0ABS4I3S2_9BACL|nr:hypothetical protein [Paenibacillus aceris]